MCPCSPQSIWCTCPPRPHRRSPQASGPGPTVLPLPDMSPLQYVSLKQYCLCITYTCRRMRPINHLRNSMCIARNSSENNDPCGTTQTLPFHLSPEGWEERKSTASRTNMMLWLVYHMDSLHVHFLHILKGYFRYMSREVFVLLENNPKRKNETS